MREEKNWRKNSAASAEALKKLLSIAPFPLPESYLRFLANSNGGEGPLSVEPTWLVLHSVEEVTETETKGTFHEFFPGHFVIGGNGAGEAVALVTENGSKEKVVFFDMTNINLDESVVALAPSFETLLALLEDRKD